ncbi:MAG TPA: leucyl aminopeptidase [Isosphaeraceae bacterium]|jgi:leucyl aminopeptidase|nr:leucyl aminopeptidase [Isosphaeraceae bacterium]
MRIRSLVQDPVAVSATWLAIGLFENEPDPPAALGQASTAALLGRLIEAKDVGVSVGDVTPVLGASGLAAEGLLVFGLGPRDKLDAGAAFLAGVAVAKKLASKPRESVAVVVPEGGDPAAIASALTEGILVGTRGPDLRKTEPARHSFGELIVVAPEGGLLAADRLEAAVRRGEVVGSAVNLARDLANLPPAEKPPTRLAERAREVASAAGCEVTVWDEGRIRQERFGGLLGVAAGSDEPPAFVEIVHRNGGDRPTLALVGKGVTFDSGGLSLKPSASMEDMKADMTGAAVVLATIQAAARLELPANLVGYMVLSENMTGGKAMKLGDVLTMRNGKTIEVLNTDAEGRLILADALSYAVEAQPARVLNLATLTGACLVALGPKVAGLFSNDDAFANDVLAACLQTGERAWRMPLDDDFLEQLKSDVADLKNIGGKYGGAITAAKFLQQFVADTPWVHLDIAGPSWSDKESGTRDAGATGCFVRTLITLIEAEATRGTDA